MKTQLQVLPQRTAALPTAAPDPESKSDDLQRLGPAGLQGVPAEPCTHRFCSGSYSSAPWFALLFPHLINLSAKPFDKLHNMAPVFLGSGRSSFQYGFQNFHISRLTHEGPPVVQGRLEGLGCFANALSIKVHFSELRSKK